MENKTKYIAIAYRWFDKINGNTYHSVQVKRIRDNAILYCQFQYGYGDHYRQTAVEEMLKAGWLGDKYNKDNAYLFERENDYPISWNVHSGLKRECVANGKVA